MSLVIDISPIRTNLGLRIDNVKLVRLGRMTSKGIEDGVVPFLATNLAEGETIDCFGNGDYYRFNSFAYLNSRFSNINNPSNPFLNKYPNASVAATWNSQWNESIISIDCAASWGLNKTEYIGDDLKNYVSTDRCERTENYILNGDFDALTLTSDFFFPWDITKNATRGIYNTWDRALSWQVSGVPDNFTDFATVDNIKRWRLTRTYLNFLLPNYLGSFVARLYHKNIRVRIAQTALTVIGQTYRLSFLLGCDSSNATHSGGKLSVRIGNITSAILTQTINVTGTAFKNIALSFRAQSNCN